MAMRTCDNLMAAGEALSPVETGDSHICYDAADAALLPYNRLAVEEALPPLEMEDSQICQDFANDISEATCSTQELRRQEVADRSTYWHPRDVHALSRLPAIGKADDTELDAMFAGKAKTSFADMLGEHDCGTASISGAMSHGAEWLTDMHNATSPLNNASDDTDVMNRLFGQHAGPRQVHHDSWANFTDFSSRSAPEYQELFKARGHQVAAMQATTDADGHAAWADKQTTQLNSRTPGFWQP